MRSCALAIAETLHEGGVRYVFGHPGGEVVVLIDALENTGIRFVLTGHEAAAFMASAIGRLTGIPGVCLARLGPGACNLVLGVGAAYLDRDPMLSISARSPASRTRVSQKQNLSLNELFHPICKWSVALEKTGVEATVRSALMRASAPPAGPVYLTIPNDVAVADAAPESPSSPFLACNGDLEAITRALNRAERPVGIVGVALNARLDFAAVRRFFAQSQIPYVVLPQAKGIPDEFGPGYPGTVASAAGDARWTTAEIRGARDAVADTICPEADASANGLSPYHLMCELYDTLPGETLLSVDVGAHKMLISQVWLARSPGTFLTSNGLSAMGCGLPSALAAALIRPGRPAGGGRIWGRRFCHDGSGTGNGTQVGPASIARGALRPVSGNGKSRTSHA